MKTDALNRRKRTETQPTGKNPRLTSDVLAFLEGLRRYHPLPTRLAFEFYPGITYYPSFQERLTDLTHERPDGEQPVIRRTEYFNPKGVLNSEPVWYELSDRGERIARGNAKNPLDVPERDHIKHRAFNACVGASLEVAKPDHMELVHLEDIVAHDRCPALTKRLSNPLLLSLGKQYVEADRLFGFKRGGGFDFYAVEIDRATETNQRTIHDKLDRWSTVMTGKYHRSFWGIPNLKIMFITTAPGRIESLLAYLRGKPNADRFLFKAFPQFGDDWRAPRRPLVELFEPWRTVNGEVDITIG